MSVHQDSAQLSLQLGLVQMQIQAIAVTEQVRGNAGLSEAVSAAIKSLSAFCTVTKPLAMAAQKDREPCEVFPLAIAMYERFSGVVEPILALGEAVLDRARLMQQDALVLRVKNRHSSQADCLPQDLVAAFRASSLEALAENLISGALLLPVLVEQCFWSAKSSASPAVAADTSSVDRALDCLAECHQPSPSVTPVR